MGASNLIVKLRLIAESKELRAGLDDARDGLNKFKAGAEKAGDSVSASFAKIGSAAASAGLAIGVAFLAGTVAATNDLLKLNAELSTLSATLNVSRENLQVWQIAAQSVGMSGDQISEVFKGVNERLGEFASNGGGEALDLIKRLKLDINDLIAMSPDQALLKIMDAMGKATDMSQGEKTFLLESLADDASRLLPLLENNAAKLDAIRERASTNLVIITPEQQALLDSANVKMTEIGSSLDGLSTQAGIAGAALVNAFGDDAASAIDSMALMVQDLPGIVEQTVGDMAASWEYATSGGEDAFSALGDYASEFASFAVDSFSYVADGARMAFTYFPVIARTAFDLAISYGDAWLNEAMAVWDDFKGSSNLAFASLLEYAKSGFVGMANAGGVAIAWLIDKLATFAQSAAATFSAMSDVPGFEAMASGAASVAGKLSGMADSARSAGSSVAGSFDSAIASLRASGAEAKASADNHRRLADEARNAGKESVKAASDFIQTKESQRAINAQIREENQELGGLAAGMDKAGGAAKKFHVNQDAVNKALAGGAGSAGKAKEAKSELEKQTEKVAKAYEDELKALKLKNSELTQTGEQYYLSTLASKDFTSAMQNEAGALHYGNTILEERKKLMEEANSVKLNPVEQYKEKLKQDGVNPGDAGELAALKQANIQDKITKELEKQQQKAKLTADEYRKWELAQEGVSAEFAGQALSQEKQIDALEKQKELANDIKEGLTNALMDAAESGFKSFKSLSDWLKDTFNNMVLRPVIQAISGGIVGSLFPSMASANGLFNGTAGGAGGGLGGILQMFTGNSFGSAISTGANALGGLGGLFSNAGSASNMSYGLAGIAGSLFGNLIGGKNAGIGGGLGATIGTAILPGIGSVVGGLLGSLVGGLFGGEVTTTGNAIDLGYNGKSGVTGRQSTTKKEDGGWLFGDSTWTEYSGLSGDFTSKMNTAFDAMEKDIVAKMNALKELGLNVGGDAAQSVLDGLTIGMSHLDLTGKTQEQQQALIDKWFSGITDKMYYAVLANEKNGVTDTRSDGYGAMMGVRSIVAEKKTGENFSTAFSRVMAEYTTVSGAFGKLDLSLGKLVGSSVRAADNLVEMAGGLDKFAASADYYYQNFFTDQERNQKETDAANKSLSAWNKTLGLSGEKAIDTKDEFRKYIESLDLTKETGQKAYTEAMKYAGSIVTVTGGLAAANSLLNPTVSCLVAKDIVSSIPKYDVGSDYIKTDQTALIHQGEMIFTASQSSSMRENIVKVMSALARSASATGNQAATGRQSSTLDDKIQSLISENQAIRGILSAILGDMNLNAVDAHNQRTETNNILSVAKAAGAFKSKIASGFA
ncbi:MAG: hypothetical protein PHE17_19645 [Thiothrix sp.]|uniref:hypothetical protein n=1 Tax=Thiothrix sp. TaxID=1032 RepID=UPI0026359D57|nr:hypothetical protein [Thiothrix sp.]MDD5395243.1 hypothetical protein [Thiothrix sp.]